MRSIITIGVLVAMLVIAVECRPRNKWLFWDQNKPIASRHIRYAPEAEDSKDAQKDIKLGFTRRPPKEKLFQEGDAFFLDCEVTGSPTPYVYFLKDGKKYEKNLEAPESYLRHLSFLEILQLYPKAMDASLMVAKIKKNCATLDMSGVYTCVAENKHGRVETVTNVKVQFNPFQISECLRKTDLVNPEVYIAMNTDTTLEVISGNAIVQCKANHPDAKISWFIPKLNGPPTDPKKYEILPNDDLMIKNVNHDDMGEYYCKATLGPNSDSYSVFVYITAEERKKKYQQP